MRKQQAYKRLYGVGLSLFFLCSFVMETVWAQDRSILLPEVSGESVILGCDREIYGAGEQVHFLASYQGPKEIDNASWSTVLYVELIDWNGSKQASAKVLLANDGFSGKMGIPKNIPSGVYYLRAYTLWMRNYSPYSYAYLPVKILNPYNKEMLARPSEGSADQQPMERKDLVESEKITLSGLKENYGTREQVEFEIQTGDVPVSGPYSLGISKTRGQFSNDYILEAYPEEKHGSEQMEFLPELHGLTLSGFVIDSESNEAVSDTRIQLSSYAVRFLYSEVHSGNDGSFLYSLPHFTGNPELHIGVASETPSGHKILLSSEFCNKPLRLPYVPLTIDSTEQSLVKEILVNAQLMERYRVGELPSDESENLYPSFYGNRAFVTYVSDYIELTDLREFIYEIIPQVSIQSNDGGSFISIQGPSCLDIYPPLILMDNIPVSNNDELLNIPGNRIERIEVLNQAYLVGNTRYSGILSIYSGKKDMSSLAQEGERNFFNFRMYDMEIPEKGFASGHMESSLPDVRNLLYWDPSISFSGQGGYRVVFTTPDTPGSYVLTLRGRDPENSVSVLATALISVK